MKKIIPITLLTGYLGSGKTTLLNHILSNQKGYKVAVIVNDIGEVNIDASLIAKGGVVKDTEGSLVPLQNGCICCTLKEDLMKQIAELVASNKFDYILIEASGICEPVPIVQTIQVLSDATKRYNLPCEVKLDNVTAVVDALRLVDEFGSGRELLNKDIDEEDIENLIIQQIEFCNKIIINKVSEVSKEQLEEVKAVVKALQPEAEILEADYGKVAIDKMLNTNSFDYEKASMSATWIKELNTEHEENENLEEDCHNDEHRCHCHNDEAEHKCRCGELEKECHCHDKEEEEHHCHCEEERHECHCHDHDTEDGCKSHNEEKHHHKKGHCHCGHHHGEGECLEYGIDTFVYVKRAPLNKQKFINFMENFPKSVIRAKGVIWVSSDEENMYMFEQAGKQKTAMNVGPWVASLPKQEQEMILLENPDVRKDWREDTGDKIIKLVFIGKNMNKAEIVKMLDDCLE